MTNEEYMLHAIGLAKNGTGFVNPNPLVGAVIIKDGKIIGEGWHEKYGELHAERNAFKNCIEPAEDADLYVTLEPCCHYGRTPPCTEAIIENKIKRVFIGSKDPNPLVSGKSVGILKEHGIEVFEGICEQECDSLNDIFFHYITTKLPFVTMKYAMTADGKIACYTGESKWITSEKAREHTHYTRKRMAAIMVGIGTVLQDNPMLDCRTQNPSNPVRIVCDSKLRIPLGCKLVKTAKDIPLYVASLSDSGEKSDKLKAMGVNIIKLSEKDGHVNLFELMKKLGEMQIDSVLLEGGGELNYSALKSGIVSKVQVYMAPKIFGGIDAKSPIGGHGVMHPNDAFILEYISTSQLGDDILIEYDVKKRGVL